MKYLYFWLGLSIVICPVLGIVPKPGVPISAYEKPAKTMNNIGHLLTQGQKLSSCSATLIGQDGNIGIVLTAGHCVSLSESEMPEKCRYQTVSFSPDNPLNHPEKFPVVGRMPLSKFIDSSTNYEMDVGVAFIDMSDMIIGITPRQILLDRTQTSDTSIVHVAGYGKTSFLDDLTNPKRRVMSTQAIRTKKNNHEMLLLDETAIEDHKTPIPIGDHPAEGDSGGPIIDINSGAVIGVVSHKEGESFYSEPLYQHAEWLLKQMKQASSYFVFNIRKSGKASDSTTWKSGRKPIKFKNAYGEINPIISLGGQQTLSLDADINPYAIHIVDEGGTLDIDSGIRHVEVLRAKAPSIIESKKPGTLIVDTLKVESSDVLIRTNLQVLYQLHVKHGIVLDIQKENPNRGITLVENGNLKIEGTLKTHHIRFLSHSSPSNEGTLHLSGTLNVAEPINHNAQAIEIRASQPSKIEGDYRLSQSGRLVFNFDLSSSSSMPLLSVDGIVNLDSGKLIMKGLEVLALGFEKTLISAKILNTSQALHISYGTNLVNDDAEIVLTNNNDLLKMKVVPRMGGTAPTFSSDEEPPLGKVF